MGNPAKNLSKHFLRKIYEIYEKIDEIPEIICDSLGSLK